MMSPLGARPCDPLGRAKPGICCPRSAPLSCLGGLFGSVGTSLTNQFSSRASGFATTNYGAAGMTLGAAVPVFFLTLLILIALPRWRIIGVLTAILDDARP